MAKNNYTTSDNGLAFIVSFEGEILHVYNDGYGYLTAGVGHLLSAAEKKQYKKNDRISREQSREWLRQDLSKAETAVRDAVTVPITQNQFDALVSLAFNIGIGGFRRSSVLRNLNARHFDAAAQAFLSWNKAGGQVSRGLVRRREAEKKLFLTPDKTASAAPLKSASTSDDPASDGPSVAPQDPATQTTVPPPLTNDNAAPNIAVEKEPKLGFWATLGKKITAAFTGIGGATGLTSYAQQAQTFGLSSLFWERIFYIAILGLAGWIVVETCRWFYTSWQRRKRTDTLAALNSTPVNQVVIVPAGDLAKYENDPNWVVVRRNG